MLFNAQSTAKVISGRLERERETERQSERDRQTERQREKDTEKLTGIHKMETVIACLYHENGTGR